MAVVLLTGFSCGLPLALTDTTLQAWLKSGGVDLAVIGLLAGVTLPYALKFLWSPLMDRFVPPFLGRRRGWMVLCQLALAAAINGMALLGLAEGPMALAGLALVVAFCSASQDIVVDAYRAEILGPEELGAGAGVYIMGYRVGIICSGALALILADRMPWRTVYQLMAAGMAVGLIATLLAPEPKLTAPPPRTMRQAVELPFAEFLRRRGAVEMLLFILIYKFDAAMVGKMMTPFMLETGFTMTDVGAVTNGLGIFATIGGAILGGAAVTRLGIRRSLWTFGLLQGLAGLSFTLLAVVGHHYPMMIAAIVVENVCSGMATAGFVGFLMSLCDKRFTATQFALLSSLMALGRTLAGMPAGWIAKQVGWPTYFVISMLVAIPGLLLLLRYPSWQRTPAGEG
jgi:PAT family beta-lactamase induction signal transducer AmpG